MQRFHVALFAIIALFLQGCDVYYMQDNQFCNDNGRCAASDELLIEVCFDHYDSYMNTQIAYEDLQTGYFEVHSGIFVDSYGCSTLFIPSNVGEIWAAGISYDDWGYDQYYRPYKVYINGTRYYTGSYYDPDLGWQVGY